VPALLVEDQRAVAVMTGLSYVRALSALSPGLLARMLTRAPRQAAVFATGGHFLSTTIFERRQRLAPFRQRTTRFFSVLDPVPKLVAQLNAFQPAMVGTYASALAALTAEQQAGRLRISPLVITSGGELLTPAVQHRAEKAFGCLVNQTYGASEAIPLALPCQYGRLHLNSDWFVVEPIDAEGRAVPPGTRSDGLLVTNLANYVQPVIRYQLGDSVVITDRRCACGSPLATILVEGRTDEILRVPRAEGGEAILLPMAMATVVEETRGVRRYQALQTATDVFTVRLDHDSGTDRAEVWQRVRAGLADLLRANGCDDVSLRLAAEPPQANPRSGKLRHYWCPRRSLRLSRTNEVSLLEPARRCTASCRSYSVGPLVRPCPPEALRGGLSRRPRSSAPGDAQGGRPAVRRIAVTLWVAHPMTSSTVSLR
jgi:hypothetical protein